MSGEGATGQVYDAAGNPLIISEARGGYTLYDPARIKIPEVQALQKEGDIVLHKKWFRHLKISLGATKQAIVLDADAYNPASGKHKDALEFVDPSNRPAYFVALQNSVRAAIVIALLKTEDALLESVLYMDLPLPEMIMKLNETFGDNTNHSLADILSEIMQTSGDLPKSYAGLISYMQQFLKLIRRYNDAGGSLSDPEALNMLMIKLSMCPLDQLSTILTIEKSEKIKDPNYSLAKFVNDLTSWASSEVDKPSNRYQKGNRQVMAVGRGSQVGRSRGNGNYKGRGPEAEAKVNMITIPMPGTIKMHIRINPRDEEKDPQVEEKEKKEKAKVKVLIMDSN